MRRIVSAIVARRDELWQEICHKQRQLDQIESELAIAHELEAVFNGGGL